MINSSYSFEGNQIKIGDNFKELDYPIQDIINLEKDNKIIVLFDRDSNIRSWGQFPNIICLSNKGDKLWTAELPTTNTGDSYHSMELKEGKLVGYSWCSFMSIIDLNTGKILERIFTK